MKAESTLLSLLDALAHLVLNALPLMGDLQIKHVFVISFFKNRVERDKILFISQQHQSNLHRRHTVAKPCLSYVGR